MHRELYYHTVGDPNSTKICHWSIWNRLPRIHREHRPNVRKALRSQMKTRQKITFIALWLFLVALIFLWTMHDYTNQPNISLKFEIIIRHILIMLALTFPSGWILNFVFSTFFYAIGINVHGIYIAFCVSLTCAIAGILQWFVFLPWCWNKWRNRKR